MSSVLIRDDPFNTKVAGKFEEEEAEEEEEEDDDDDDEEEEMLGTVEAEGVFSVLDEEEVVAVLFSSSIRFWFICNRLLQARMTRSLESFVISVANLSMTVFSARNEMGMSLLLNSQSNAEE
tara:strand:+ start:102 stop:467 length:366 start_codon:yes stop_codon:yes gene_type:complete